MKKSRLFEIAYVGLKMGEHVFDYQIDNRFLEQMEYEGEPLNNLDCKVRVRFEKLTNLFQLNFDFNGKTSIACDRCGDDMDLDIWDEHKLIIKLSFDDQMQEMIEDDDVVFLPKHETVIDLSKWIYEFLMLSLPIQHIHGTDEAGNSLCNPEVIRLLEAHQANEVQAQRDKLWSGLNNLKEEK